MRIVLCLLALFLVVRSGVLAPFASPLARVNASLSIR